MTKLAEIKARLLPFVKEHAEIKLPEPIQLSSGKMSGSYFDGRKVTLHPEGMTLFARAILELVNACDFDAVGGPSIGADPIATAVSLIAYLEQKVVLPAFLVRKEAKRCGLQKQVEGIDLKPGMKALIVEDVITTGGSVRRACEGVEGLGASVGAIVCLIDRGEGGEETLRPRKLLSVFTKEEVG